MHVKHRASRKRPETLRDDFEAAFFKPFVRILAEQEGSWWWTSNSDESGSSQCAADTADMLHVK